MSLYKRLLRFTTTFIFIIIVCVNLKAQTDSVFWFAVPNVEEHHTDRPVGFHFTNPSTTSSSTVTISQPAEPAFTPKTIVMPPSSSVYVDLTDRGGFGLNTTNKTWKNCNQGLFTFTTCEGPITTIDSLENKPANTVNKKGVLITATSPITAYYEVTGLNYQGQSKNGDLFALKGSNALGLEFFTPFQNIADNQTWTTSTNTQWRSAFDIVATENGTVVEITPTQDIIGHATGITFTVNLNKGETYSGVANTHLAAGHPAGSYIKSNKPIAVTIKDDSVNGAGIGISLVGDQIIPTSVFGSEYIVIKGTLHTNPAPGNARDGEEYAFIGAATDNTQITIDGSVVATINKGQQYLHSFKTATALISSSFPVSVFHLTGVGSEVGGAVLPPITCTGSDTVGFTRSSGAAIYSLSILVPAGGEGNFILNGGTGFLTAADFTTVPNTGGAWKYAQKDFSTAIVDNDNLLLNTTHLFHLGTINGVNGGDASYGYFSNFDRKPAVITAQPSSPKQMCAGNGVVKFFVTATGKGTLNYQWREVNGGVATNIANGGVYSGTNTDTLTITNAGTSFNGKTFNVLVTRICSPVGVSSNTVTLIINPIAEFTVEKQDATTCGGTGKFIFKFTNAYKATSPTGTFNLDLNGDGTYEYVNQTAVGDSITVTGIAVGTIVSNWKLKPNSTTCTSNIVNNTLTIGQPTNPLPPTVTNISFCKFTVASALTATPIASTILKWYGLNSIGGTGNIAAPVPPTTTVGTTSYYVLDSNTTTRCISTRAKKDVTINPLPNFTVATTDPSTCGGTNGSLRLTLPTAATNYSVTYTKGAITYGPTTFLTNGSNVATISSSLTQGSISNIIVQDINNCTFQDNGPYTLTDPTAPTNTTASTSICADGITTRSLTGVPSGTWSLAPGSTASIGTISGNTFTVGTVAGTAIIRNSNLNCNTDVSITINAKPVVTIVNPSPVCASSTVDLTLGSLKTGSTAGLTYTYFNDNAATSSLSNANAVAVSNTYYIKGMISASGCFDIKPVVVTVNPKPTISVVKTDPATCIGTGSVNITVTSGAAGLYDIDLNGDGSYEFTNQSAASNIITLSGLAVGTLVKNVVIKSVVSTCFSNAFLINSTVTAPSAPSNTTSSSAMCADGVSTRSLTGSAGTWTLLTGSIGNISGITYTVGNASGTATIRLTNGGCNSDVTITINSIPLLNITTPPAVCSPSAVDITTPATTNGSTAGIVLTYFTNAAATTVHSTSSTSANGLYYIKGTINGCSAISSVSVTVNTSPGILVSTSNPTTCAGTGSATISIGTATGNYDIDLDGDNIYEFTNITPVGNLITIGNLTAGKVIKNVKIKSVTTGCTSVADPINTAISAPSSPSNTTSTSAMCADGLTTKNLQTFTPGGTWSLAPGSTAGIGTINSAANTFTIGNISGTAIVRYTLNNCTADVTFLVNSISLSSVIKTDAAVCGATGMVELTIVNASGTYDIDLNGDGTFEILNQALTIGDKIILTGLPVGTPIKNVKVKSNTTLCESNVYLIDTSISAPLAPNNSTSSSAMCADGSSQRALSATPAGGSWSLASGSTANIGIISGTSFLVGNVSGIAIIRYSLLGCDADVSINIQSTPSVVITNPAEVCAPNTIDLTNSAVTSGSTANLGFTYFTDAAATNVLNLPSQVSTTGTYYIKGTTAANCSAVALVNVVVNSKPNLIITDPAEACAPSLVDITAPSVTLGSSSGLGYSYYTDTIATNILSNADKISASGKYFIKATNTTTTCYSIKPVTVILNGKPTIVITNPNAVCAPLTIDLTDPAITNGSNSSLTYTYFSDAAGTATLSNPNAVNNSNTYYIKGSSTASCSDIKSVTVAVNAKPTLVITNPSPLCEPNTQNLTSAAITNGSTASLSFQYFTNASATDIATTPTAVGSSSIYYIVGKTIASCSDTALVTITINKVPVISVLKSDATTCAGKGSATIDITSAAGNYDIDIDGDNIFDYFNMPTNSNAILLPNLSIGQVIKFVTLKSVLTNCISKTDPIDTKIAAPATPLNTTNTDPVCGNGNTLRKLTAFPAGGTWSLAPGSSASDGAVNNSAGEYTSGNLKGTVIIRYTLNNCESDVTIVVNPQPKVAPIAPTILCSNGSTNVILSSDIVSNISWITTKVLGLSGNGAGSGNNINQKLTNINASSVDAFYKVIAIASNCASDTVVGQVTIHPLPKVSNVKHDSLCSESITNISLVSNVTGSTFSYITKTVIGVTGNTSGSGNKINQKLSNNSNNSEVITYNVIATANNCSGPELQLPVTINPNPVFTGLFSDTICSGGKSTVPLSATVSSTVYSWATTPVAGVSGNAAGTGIDLIQTLSNSNNTFSTVFYNVTPTANNCRGASATVTISVYPLSNAGTVTGGDTLCEGSASSAIKVSGNNGRIIKWETSTSPFTNWNNIITSKNTYQTGQLFENTKIRVSVNSGVCAIASSTPIDIIIDKQTNNANAGADQLFICAPKTTLSANSPTGKNTGAWNIKSGFNGTIENQSLPQTFFNGVDGNSYTLTWTLTNGKCPSTSDDIIVKINQTPSPAVAGIDQLNLCGTMANIEATPPAVGTGSWKILDGTGGLINDTLAAKTSISGVPSNRYLISWKVTASPVCPSTKDETTISFSPTPTGDAGPDQTIKRDRFTIMNATGGVTYSWLSTSTLDKLNIANPIASPKETTTYGLKIFNQYGCSIIDSVTVFVIQPIFPTNTFTPNGDNENPVWVIQNIKDYPKAEITIFNRWGQVIRKFPYDVEWDGTLSNGATAEVGTYFYVIDLKDTDYKPYSGSVSILR